MGHDKGNQGLQGQGRHRDTRRPLPPRRDQAPVRAYMDTRRRACYGKPRVRPREPARIVPGDRLRAGIHRLPARAAGKAPGHHRGPERRGAVDARDVPALEARRGGRIRGRLPCDDDRHFPGSAPRRPRLLLRLRRRGRGVVHTPFRPLPEAFRDDHEGRGGVGHGQPGGDRRRGRPRPAGTGALLPLPAPEGALDPGSHRHRSRGRTEGPRPLLSRP